LLILAIGLWPHHPKLGRVPIALGAAMALSSLVLTGHAANAPPAVLSAPGVFLHGIAAAFWVGSLWPLRVLVRRLPAEQALPSVRGFSGIASVSVALLAVSGIILSAVQIGNVDAILASPYGRTWLLKISLVLVLLALATLNRLVLTPGLSNGSRAGLSYSIAVEIAVVAGILATTSMLGQTPPPRALEGRDHSAHGHHPVGAAKSFEMKSGAYRARMQISPASRGLNRIVVHLSVGNGEPLAASDVVTVWTHARAGVEGFQRTLKPAADHFEGEVELPLAGEWTVSVEALVSDFEKASFRTTVVLPLPSGDS
jgi:copper transport protein